VGHTLRSSGLLCVEASWAMGFQSDLKTGGGTITSVTHVIIVEVASRRS
jgi:hypothetical protein